MPEGFAGGKLSVTWRVSSPAYRSISGAMFLAGFATFSLVYCVQPLLPAFARDFHIGPAESSLALSATTVCLAAAIVCAAAGSEVLGRRGVMFGSMCAAAILNVTDAVAPTWHALLTARALEGLALGGVPAVAMAYLAEEIHPQSLGLSMGLYVGGTAFGGMLGRVAIGALTESMSWRLALGILGAIDLLAALGFFALLPDSRHFKQRSSLDPSYHLSAWWEHLRHPGLRFLFLIGCLTTGAFVTINNYASFRLAAPPYNLSPTQVNLIFVVYLFGIVASPFAGALADRLGRGPMLIASITIAAIGIGLTLLRGLGAIIVGIVIMTIGFFIAHSVASGWVGSMAGRAKGHAASLYLLAYYLGSSVMGSIGGWFWESGGWTWVAGFTALLLAIAWVAAQCVDRS
jgi:MFS transporter, YNFM family, putative membrane transport protein